MNKPNSQVIFNILIGGAVLLLLLIQLTNEVGVFGGIGGQKAVLSTLVIDPNNSSSAATSTKQLGHIFPTDNNAFDLGLYGNAYRNFKTSGTVFIGGGSATATLEVTAKPGFASCWVETTITGLTRYKYLESNDTYVYSSSSCK